MKSADASRAVAIRRRDASQDGRFVYGVVTTGVYCRPSCGSRRPRPENVRFFDRWEAAEAAGFRACRRCHPKASVSSAQAIEALAHYIENHADQPLTLNALAARVGLSGSRLQRQFKARFGVSPKVYQDSHRRARLKKALRHGEDVAGAIFSAGYGSTSRAYSARRNLGMTPSQYRSGGAGEKIYHAFRETTLGPLLMAATPRGVCFVQFGRSRCALLQQLKAEFPRAVLVASPAAQGHDLDRWIAALERHLQDHGPAPDLPLDLRGTAFQLLVWEFLLSVKPGDVVSYGEVAAGIGRPGAARAAASACGANSVALLVPCHRVLRGDGALGGYRWGMQRKLALLDLERGDR